jgi:hypothetical protein
MEGMNLTKIYCKYFCKCHSVPQYNNIIKERNKKIYEYSFHVLVGHLYVFEEMPI